MNAFKLLSIVLLYPNEELFSAEGVRELKEFSKEHRLAFLDVFFEYMQNTKLIEAQKHYSDIFDLTPKFSLYLFDHEKSSKDRGIKLLSLKDEYANEGLELNSNQSPDYIPIFFEYLSLIDKQKAITRLKYFMPILKELYFNLKGVSPYESIFYPFRKEDLDELF